MAAEPAAPIPSVVLRNEAEEPESGGGGHRTDKAADKLAAALAAKYLFELNPARSHKSNVHALLAKELHDLTRQALAFRTARLPPRVLCRLNAFIANLCAAVPESPLPSAFMRLGSLAAAGGAGGRRPSTFNLEADEEELILAQVSAQPFNRPSRYPRGPPWAALGCLGIGARQPAARVKRPVLFAQLCPALCPAADRRGGPPAAPRVLYQRPLGHSQCCQPERDRKGGL